MSVESPPKVNSPSSRYGLVCTGGGAIGAYQAGVLAYVHKHYCKGEQSPFKIFTGVSCGALNTSYLACHSHEARSCSENLQHLWEAFHVPEYHRRLKASLFNSIFKKLLNPSQPWSLFDPSLIWQVVEKQFNRESLEAALEHGSTLGLATSGTELVSGYPVWFLEGPAAVPWQRFHSIGLLNQIEAKHIVASCSVPFFMPTVKIGYHEFMDGMLNLSRPFTAAVSMGATHVLCINTSNSAKSRLPNYFSDFRSGFKAQFNLMIKTFGQDNSFSEYEQIKVLNRFAEEIPPSPKKDRKSSSEINAVFDKAYVPTEYNPIEVQVITPSLSPAELFRDFNITKRNANRHEYMFHRDFLKRLTDFGYQDAENTYAKVLDSFFSEQTKESNPINEQAEATNEKVDYQPETPITN